MAVQNSASINTGSIITRGLPYAHIENSAVIAQDAARATPLAQYTLMARIAATGKYVPLTSLTATDGSAIPAGIYLGDAITAARLVAGDITDCQIVVGFSELDETMLVIENSLTLASVFSGNAAGTGTATPYFVLRVRDLLRMISLVPRLYGYAGNVEN